MDKVKLLPCDGVIVQLLRQKLDMSDGLLDDLEESGNLQEVARAMLLEVTRPTLVTDELVERGIAEIIHDAMVWAAQQGGQPQRWQNGNSFAEGRAREAARAIAAMPTLVTGQLEGEGE